MDWNVGNPLPRYHPRLFPVVRDVEGREVHRAAFIEAPALSAHGESGPEAIARLWDALPAYLQQLTEYGLEVPDPQPQGEIRIGRVTLLGVAAEVVTQPLPVDQPDELRLDQVDDEHESQLAVTR